MQTEVWLSIAISSWKLLPIKLNNQLNGRRLTMYELQFIAKSTLIIICSSERCPASSCKLRWHYQLSRFLHKEMQTEVWLSIAIGSWQLLPLKLTNQMHCLSLYTNLIGYLLPRDENPSRVVRIKKTSQLTVQRVKDGYFWMTLEY